MTIREIWKDYSYELDRSDIKMLDDELNGILPFDDYQAFNELLDHRLPNFNKMSIAPVFAGANEFVTINESDGYHMYDLERYEEELRGFYIDIYNEVPGPILRTTDEVIDALGDLDNIDEQYGKRYEEFCEKYCSLEDGDATKRVVEKVWPH